jgi:phage terminase small subunit
MNIAATKITELASIEDDYGPAMQACLPKELAFILALLEGRNGAQAAREAGYGNNDGTTSAESFARIAHRTLTRGRVIDALTEQSRKTIRSLAPSAIQAVKDILTTTNHKDRAKVALNMLERVDPVVQRIDAHVTHEIVDHKQEALIQLRSLKALGVAHEKLEELFGFTGLPMLEKQLAEQDANQPIDAEFTEIKPEIRIEDL